MPSQASEVRVSIIVLELTSTVSVAIAAEVAKSNIPMLGYAVPYAVSNLLLALWGVVIVLLLS